MDEKRAIRILLADDHPVVRDGLLAILSTQPDFSVIGEAATGSEALEKTLDLQPDVLLLDLEMPDMDGAQVLEKIRASEGSIKTLVFTAYDTDERILTALRMGAQGYLLKGAPREELFNAIRVVASGGSLLEPVVALKLIQQVNRGQHPDGGQGLVEPLSRRELEVLACLAQGMTNRDIAQELVITERTVKFHVSAILAKLGASNRTEALKKAAEMKMIRL